MTHIVYCRERTARRHANAHQTVDKDLYVLQVDLSYRAMATQKTGLNGTTATVALYDRASPRARPPKNGNKGEYAQRFSLRCTDELAIRDAEMRCPMREAA